MLKSNLSINAQIFITLLSELSKKDRTILIERFVRNKSLKEVAKQFKISDARLKEIEDKLILQVDQLHEFNLTKISKN